MNSNPSHLDMSATADESGDFADWLSPMVVKELRQGLRSRAFTLLFMIIQVVMVLATFVCVSSANAQVMVGIFFWLILGFAVAGLIPLRGLQAINGEIGENTLDLLVLTRMRALRIVMGKWAALVAQALLVSVAVLPYIFLRYFLGGVNILQEVFLLGLLLLVAAVLSALTVCLSASSGKRAGIGRNIVVGVVLFLLIFQATAMFIAVGRGGLGTRFLSFSLDMKAWLLVLPVTLGFATYLIYFFLEIGAGRLAHAASNHSTRRRLVSLGVVIPLVLLTIFEVSPSELWSKLVMTTLLIAAIDALTDLPSVVRSVLVPFHAWRVRGASYFLAPGWHTGALYSLVLLALFGGIVTAQIAGGTDRAVIFFLFPSIIAAPAAMMVLFLSHRGKPFRDYLLIHLISICISAVLAGLSAGQDHLGYLVFACFFTPHASVPLLDSLETSEMWWAAVVSGAHLLLAFVILLWRGKPLLGKMRRLNAEIHAGRQAIPENSSELEE